MSFISKNIILLFLFKVLIFNSAFAATSDGDFETWLASYKKIALTKGISQKTIDITFKDVYPLYGQIDIVASSEARNDAIKKDLLDQLDIILNIIGKAYEIEQLPIYDQVKYRISDFKEELESKLNASSEQKVFNV